VKADITSNADQVAADLQAAGLKAGARAFAITRVFGQLLLANVKRRASLPRTGPPGPRIQTGNYVRSMGLRLGAPGGHPTAVVGTNAPQGRRLELGFQGTDSAGRTYSQPPYPHWGPALDEITPLFVEAIARVGDPDGGLPLPDVPQGPSGGPERDERGRFVRRV